jgi:hypothetical protein
MHSYTTNNLSDSNIDKLIKESEVFVEGNVKYTEYIERIALKKVFSGKNVGFIAPRFRDVSFFLNYVSQNEIAKNWIVDKKESEITFLTGKLFGATAERPSQLFGKTIDVAIFNVYASSYSMLGAYKNVLNALWYCPQKFWFIEKGYSKQEELSKREFFRNLLEKDLP